MTLILRKGQRIKREEWNKRIEEYKKINRKSLDTKKMLDEKFGEIYQIIYEELTDYEKNQADTLLQSVLEIQDIKKLDKEYTQLIKRGEAYILASKSQKLWRKLFEKYRHIPNIQYSSERGSEYLKLLGLHNTTGYILDIGCRDGSVSKIINNSLGNVIGIDIYIPKEREKSVPLIKGDGCNLPFSNNSFDLIVCLNVIEHLPDPQLLLKECARCLSEEGTLYVVCPNKYFLIEPHTGIPFISCLPKSLQDIISPWFVGYKLNSYPIHHFFSIQELKVLLSKNEFEIIEAKGFVLGDYLFPSVFILIHKFFKSIRFYNICPPTLSALCKKKGCDLTTVGK